MAGSRERILFCSEVFHFRYSPLLHLTKDHLSFILKEITDPHLKTLSTNYYPQHWLLECLIHSTNSILDVIHNNVINSQILLNNRNIYSQKLGTHIPTVILLLFLYYSFSLLISCKYVHCTYINVLYNSQNTYIVLCNFRTKGSFIQVYTPIRVEWCELWRQFTRHFKSDFFDITVLHGCILYLSPYRVFQMTIPKSGLWVKFRAVFITKILEKSKIRQK